MTRNGAVDGDHFAALCKDTPETFSCCNIVVTVNLNSHKTKGVRQAIDSAEASVLYLPPYNPDLN